MRFISYSHAVLLYARGQGPDRYPITYSRKVWAFEDLLMPNLFSSSMQSARSWLEEVDRFLETARLLYFSDAAWIADVNRISGGVWLSSSRRWFLSWVMWAASFTNVWAKSL